MEQKQTGIDKRPSGTEGSFTGRQVPQWTVALGEVEEEVVEKEKEEEKKKRKKKKKKKKKKKST